MPGQYLAGATRAMGAVTLAMLTSAAVDVSVTLSRGWDLAPDYLLLCLLTALVTGAVAALVGNALGGLAAALGLWAGVHGIVPGVFINARSGWPLGLALAAVTWLVLRPVCRDRGGLWTGLAVGLMLASGAAALPRALVILGLTFPTDLGYELCLLAVYAMGLGCIALYDAWATRHRGSAYTGPLVLCLCALSMVATHWLMPRPHGQRSLQPRPAAEARALAPAAGRPHIFVVVLDTVRADRMSVYGYQRDTTPFLERLVEEDDRVILFPEVHAPSSWTLPSHASLFSGALPSAHGVHVRRRVDIFKALGTSWELRAEETLAERLKEHGYETTAIVANMMLTRFHGMTRGFDQFVNPSPPGSLTSIGERIRAAWLPWALAHRLKPYTDAGTIVQLTGQLLEQRGDAPQFVLLNFMEAHDPFAAPPPYRGRFSDALAPPRSDAYDEELLGLDAALEGLFEGLRRAGVLEDSWVFLTSDHGEGFGEHGSISHARSLHREEIQIPLIVHVPRGESMRVHEGPVGLLDVAATVAAIGTGLEFGEGRDLRVASLAAAPVRSELYGTPDEPDLRTAARAVAFENWKLVEARSGLQLFDLGRDPGEQTNRVGSERARVAELERLLPRLEAPAPDEGPLEEVEPGLDAREQLRSLGYIQ